MQEGKTSELTFLDPEPAVGLSVADPRYKQPKGEIWTHLKEKFSQEYISTGNASEAYRRTFDISNMQPSSVWVKASVLKNSTLVAERIKELQEIHAERNNITVDKLTTKLHEAVELAKDEGQPSAMTSAVMGIAKLHGMANDKATVVHTGNVDHNHTIEFVEPDGTSSDTE